jgi:hypothetical protein
VPSRCTVGRAKSGAGSPGVSNRGRMVTLHARDHARSKHKHTSPSSCPKGLLPMIRAHDGERSAASRIAPSSLLALRLVSLDLKLERRARANPSGVGICPSWRTGLLAVKPGPQATHAGDHHEQNRPPARGHFTPPPASSRRRSSDRQLRGWPEIGNPAPSQHEDVLILKADEHREGL